MAKAEFLPTEHRVISSSKISNSFLLNDFFADFGQQFVGRLFRRRRRHRRLFLLLLLLLDDNVFWFGDRDWNDGSRRQWFVDERRRWHVHHDDADALHLDRQRRRRLPFRGRCQRRGFLELRPAPLLLSLSLFAALTTDVRLIHLENAEDDDADENDAENRAEKNAWKRGGMDKK